MNENQTGDSADSLEVMNQRPVGTQRRHTPPLFNDASQKSAASHSRAGRSNQTRVIRVVAVRHDHADPRLLARVLLNLALHHKGESSTELLLAVDQAKESKEGRDEKPRGTR